MQNLLRWSRLAVSAALMAVLVMCSGGGFDQSPPVARVGNQSLTERDIEVMLRGTPGDRATPEERWAVAERWVNRELLYREAVRQGLLDDPEVQTQIKTAEREIVVNALIESAYHRELAVTEDEIQQYYNDHRALFRRQETTVRAREIILDGLAEARSVHRQVTRVPNQFEDIARRQSIDPSASEGGDLGYISATTAYNQEIWQALQRLSEGQISRPISTDVGWSVLMVVDRRPEGSIKTLDEVRIEIINRIRATKRWSVVTELIERLKLQEPYVFYAERLGPREVRYEGPGDSLMMFDDMDIHD